jgi:hypothetical protein
VAPFVIGVIVAVSGIAGLTPEPATAGTVPVNDVAPGFDRPPTVGNDLYARRGSWHDADDAIFEYQIVGCGTDGLACTTPLTAPQESLWFRIPRSAAGQMIVMREIATSEGGTASADSAPEGPVPDTPYPDTDPTIPGTPRTGWPVTVVLPEWVSDTQPITVAPGFWLRCWQGSVMDCDIPPDSDGPTYVPTGDDVGFVLRYVAVATNAGGESGVLSDESEIVVWGPPVNVDPPRVLPDDTATVAVGAAVTADPGTWTGSEPLTFTYQWQACGTDCRDIDGATAATHVPHYDADRPFLAVVVTAHDVHDGATAASSCVDCTAVMAPATTPATTPVVAAPTPQPPATPTGGAGSVALTGADSADLARAGAALLLAGAGLVIAARRPSRPAVR